MSQLEAKRHPDPIKPRRAEVQLWYRDTNISGDVAPMLVSLEYTGFASGQVDDLQVVIKDPDGRWRDKWYPRDNPRLRAKILLSEGTKTSVLRCGDFVVDSPGYSDGIITLKATSASVKTSLRRQRKARRWKSATLKQVADRIGGEHGIPIHLKGPDTPPIAKVEQKDESDLAFLLRICKREGYGLRVGLPDVDGVSHLIIYPRTAVDTAPPVMTISGPSGGVLSYSFDEDNVDAYRSCTLRYKHPHKKLISAVSAVDESAPEDGPTLVVREHVGSIAEAQRVAQAKLALANRNRLGCTMTLPGDTRLIAGATVLLSEWGAFNGKWAIDEAKHVVGGGYSVTLRMVKVP